MPYRNIHTTIWSDSWFESLPAFAKYFFLYLITNGHCGQAGLYPLSIRRMAFDTALNEDEVNASLKALKPKIHYQDGWVWVVNFLKYQTSSPKFLLAAYRQAMQAPRELFIRWQEHNQKQLSPIARTLPPPQPCHSPSEPVPEERPYPIDTVSIPSAYGGDTPPIPYQHPIDTRPTGTGTETEQHTYKNNATIMPVDNVQAPVVCVVSDGDGFVSLVSLLPEKHRTNAAVLKELKAAHERYGGEQSKAAILYTNAHYKTNYPAYLAKAVTNGWSLPGSDQHPPKPREPPPQELEEQAALVRQKEAFMALSPEQQEREIELTIKKNTLLRGRSRDMLELATIQRLLEEGIQKK